jgi:predicted amidophosphoribosyltransferase
MKDLEAQLKLARAELDNVRSDNAHLQAMAQTAGADTDHLRRQYNSALEEVMQMKKFHAVYQHDSTMHRQLESAWHREREIMQASVTQLQSKINEQERALAKANERALALETQNAAQVDETKRAEIVLEKASILFYESLLLW